MTRVTAYFMYGYRSVVGPLGSPRAAGRVLNGGATLMSLAFGGEQFVDGSLVRQPTREEGRAA